MIKAVIGLGNPGKKFTYTRHNAGFLIVDALIKQFHETFRVQDMMECAELSLGEPAHSVLVVKPQTFMNNSGHCLPKLLKKGISADTLLVVHDELELPLGKIKIKQGGSARGHNGLRSLIQGIGPDFFRLAFGIGRPEKKEDVAEYVLAPFDDPQVSAYIEAAAQQLLQFIEQQQLG